MKITFVGTGTMGCTTRCNTSILVDNILFDIGMGTVKQIERLKIYMKTVDYLVISHFHADHFLDIPNLLWGRISRKETNKKLVFIGPRGLKKKVKELMLFTHADGNLHAYDNMEEELNVEFIELQNGESYEAENFKITAYELHHGTCKPINGYLLEKDNQKIAYATDTTFCDNYDKMCEVADYMFSEVAKIETTDCHIGLNDFKNIDKKYPNCRFYGIHRGDYDISGIQNIQFPEDGEILKI